LALKSAVCFEVWVLCVVVYRMLDVAAKRTEKVNVVTKYKINKYI